MLDSRWLSFDGCNEMRFVQLWFKSIRIVNIFRSLEYCKIVVGKSWHRQMIQTFEIRCHYRHGILLMLVIKTAACIVSFKYHVGKCSMATTTTTAIAMAMANRMQAVLLCLRCEWERKIADDSIQFRAIQQDEREKKCGALRYFKSSDVSGLCH